MNQQPTEPHHCARTEALCALAATQAAFDVVAVRGHLEAMWGVPLNAIDRALQICSSLGHDVKAAAAFVAVVAREGMPESRDLRLAALGVRPVPAGGVVFGTVRDFAGVCVLVDRVDGEYYALPSGFQRAAVHAVLAAPADDDPAALGRGRVIAGHVCDRLSHRVTWQEPLAVERRRLLAFLASSDDWLAAAIRNSPLAHAA